MKTIRIVILTFACLYALAALYLTVFQRNFLYFPAAASGHRFEKIVYTVGKEKLDVIVLNRGKPHALLYFGGNGESVVFNAPAFERLFTGHTVYLVNYRGYGGSTGSPTEEHLYSDAGRIYDAIVHDHQKISVIGRSLGSGVATYLAANKKIDKLVLITPFDSIENIAKAQYPVFPVSLLLKDKYDSASRVKDIEAPTMIIVAENDRVIPKQFSNALIAKFPQSGVVVEKIKNAGHNDLSNYDRYYTLLDGFLSVR